MTTHDQKEHTMQPIVFHLGRDPGEKYPIRLVPSKAPTLHPAGVVFPVGEEVGKAIESRGEKGVDQQQMKRCCKRNLCLLGALNADEINARWHEKECIELIRSAGAHLIAPFLFVVANSYLKISIWPSAVRRTAAS